MFYWNIVQFLMLNWSKFDRRVTLRSTPKSLAHPARRLHLLHEPIVRGQSRGVQANEYDTLSINARRWRYVRRAFRVKGISKAKNVRGLITLFTGMPLFVKE